VSAHWPPRDDPGHFLLGCLDVVFAFSLALEKKGLLDRSEIVDTLTQVRDQSLAQEGRRTARTAVAEVMLQAFAMPVAGDQARGRLRVLEGGRD
jgi:hypothetical protein